MKRRTLLTALALSGCARSQVTTTQSPRVGRLPPPTFVVVTDFTLPPDHVQLDSGIGARLEREAKGEQPAAAQAAAARATRETLTSWLAATLAGYGLPVERLPVQAVPPHGSVLVQGQIVALDEGNRTRRTVVGLGAGESRLHADVQLYDTADPRHPWLLRSFTGTAGSGRMPGAAGTMGIGAVAGHVATSVAASGAAHAGAEMRQTPGTALAQRLAQDLARQIGAFAAREGWIAPDAVR
ncbi:MAG: DUF4410 domain-containing protein [Rhodospirillales bacterium]|nr:DUF4410 domain-containing protein [Rhodospirillales bacterium]